MSNNSSKEATRENTRPERTQKGKEKMLPFITKAPEILPEQAEAAQRFGAMKADGWREIESMDSGQLDALEEEINAAEVRNLDIFHPHVQIIAETRKAVRHRRMEINAEIRHANLGQQTRTQKILAAQCSIREAMAAIDNVAAIDPAPYIIEARTPEPLELVDVSEKTDDELAMLISMCKENMKAKAPIADYRLFAMLNYPASKALAKEIQAQTEACGRFIESARANIDAATAELEKRQAARREQEEREIKLRETLPDTIEELQARIAELEAKQ